MTDFPIFELHYFLSRDNNKEYQEKMRRLAHNLATFLVSESLLEDGSIADKNLASEGFDLWYRHLNADGKELVMSQAVDRWMAAIDRGTPPEKTTILKKAIDDIRGNNQP